MCIKLKQLGEFHFLKIQIPFISDSYMVVGSAPSYCPAPEAAEKVGLFALDAIKFVEKFKAPNGKYVKNKNRYRFWSCSSWSS